MRALCNVVLLAVIGAICAAFYFGVFNLTTEREDAAYKVSLVIHPDRLTSAEKKAAALIGHAKTEGTISTVAESEQTFTVATKDRQELTFHIDAHSNISGTPLRGLHVGDRVTVTYQTTDGKNLARNVTIESGS